MPSNIYNQFYNVEWFADPILQSSKQYKVTDGHFILDYIPDSEYNILISGYNEVKFNQELENATDFSVDYNSGKVNVSSTLDGQMITVTSYYAKGLIKTYAKRVEIQDEDNNWNSTNIEDLSAEIANNYSTKQYINDTSSVTSQHVNVIICDEGTTLNAGSLPMGTIVVAK